MSVLLVVLVLFGFNVSGVRSMPVVNAKVFVGSGGFSTIQAAINAANETETVQVMSGTYYEHVVVNKSISLVGEDWTTTIIDGGGSGEVIRVATNSVRITGFTIRNGGISGISIANCHSQNISGNLVSVNGTGLGVDVRNCSRSVFLWNNVTACGWPIKLQDSDDNIISGNFLRNNYGQTISLYRSENNTVTGNSVSFNPAYGIYLEESNNNTVSRNNITDVCEGIHLKLSNNNTVAENAIARASPYGVILEHSNGTLISKNVITDDNSEALVLTNCNGNIVDQNRIEGNKWGVLVLNSGGNIFTGNSMNQNWLGSLGVFGLGLSDFLNMIDASNTVNGKPVYYWVNQHDREVPSDAGCVAIINSTEIRIRNLNLTGNYDGVLLAYSNHTSLDNLRLSNNFHGLWLWRSNENTITDCTLKDSVNALYMRESDNNLIYGNNFVNEQKPDVAGTHNSWDNGYPEGGNYWSDYTRSDNFRGVFQNITGSDALGDRPHVIDSGNQDRFPLMSTIVSFDAGHWEGVDCRIQIVSNSTISAFRFDANEGPFIHFNATGSNETAGFCRVTIPKQLLWVEDDEWNVTVGDQMIVPMLMEDGNRTYLFLAYVQGSMAVRIQGTQVIPEYPRLFPVLLAFFVMFSVCMVKRLVRRKGLVT
jgi:parallel beta-helix repeat protein